MNEQQIKEELEFGLLGQVKQNSKRIAETPKKKPKSKLESDVQKEIVKVFIENGFEVIRYNSRFFYAPNSNVGMNCNYNYNTGAVKGHPDIKITKHSVSIGVEVKRPTGGLSDDQIKYWIKSLQFGNQTVMCISVEQARFLVLQLEKYNLHTAIGYYQREYPHDAKTSKKFAEINKQINR